MAKQRPAAAHTVPKGTDDDALVFRAAVRDVKPLAQSTVASGLAKPRVHRRKSAAGAAAGDLAHSMPLIAEGAGDGEASGAANLVFRRPGVRMQELRRLQRGLYPVEEELDLHGLSQAAARDNLAQFLVQNRDAGRRCVKIIHGKGYRSGARGPILKIAVNSWLRRHADVLAFISTRPIDGGTGAVYVLLRA
jgi:DNA-nicking Smr family endonuclease